MIGAFKLCSKFPSSVFNYYGSGISAKQTSQSLNSPIQFNFLRFASSVTTTKVSKKKAPIAKKKPIKSASKPVSTTKTAPAKVKDTKEIKVTTPIKAVKEVKSTPAKAKETAPPKAKESKESKKGDKKVSQDKIDKAKNSAVIRKKKEQEMAKQMKEKMREKNRKEKQKEKELFQTQKIKEKKQKEKERKAARPKRGKSAYVFFVESSFNAVRKLNPNDKASEITKKIAIKWNSMSDAEKKPFIEEAKKDSERYLKDKAEAAKLAPPKRPLSAFILFSQDKRDGILKKKIIQILKFKTLPEQLE